MSGAYFARVDCVELEVADGPKGLGSLVVRGADLAGSPVAVAVDLAAVAAMLSAVVEALSLNQARGGVTWYQP